MMSEERIDVEPEDDENQVVAQRVGPKYSWSDRFEDVMVWTWDVVSLTTLCIGRMEKSQIADLHRQLLTNDGAASRLRDAIALDRTQLAKEFASQNSVAVGIIYQRLQSNEESLDQLTLQIATDQNTLGILTNRKNTALRIKNMRKLNRLLDYYARHEVQDPADLIATQEQVTGDLSAANRILTADARTKQRLKAAAPMMRHMPSTSAADIMSLAQQYIQENQIDVQTVLKATPVRAVNAKVGAQAALSG